MKCQTATIETITRTVENSHSWRGSLNILTAIALLGFATLSFAQSGVPDCDGGKLSDYEKLGATGCLIGDKKFSNFQYHQGSAGLASDAISLTPGTTAENNDPDSSLRANRRRPPRTPMCLTRSKSKPHGKPITGAGLEMQFGKITGTGKAAVRSDLCSVNGTSDDCGAQKLELMVVLSAQGPKQAQDNAKFKDPQREIRVVTPVDVAPGSGGTAALDGFMAVFQ